VLAFLLSELAAAFQLALAVLLPFLIIDLLTANTLAVLGWGLLVRGLVASDG
jgi:flagellar biosynthesis protein FliP